MYEKVLMCCRSVSVGPSLNPKKISMIKMQSGGTEIAAVSTEKDIGFWIWDDLSTTTHLQKARCKALAEICRIRRNFSYIDKRAFCTLYNQRIRPHLDYGIWTPGTVAEQRLLEAAQ